MTLVDAGRVLPRAAGALILTALPAIPQAFPSHEPRTTARAYETSGAAIAAPPQGVYQSTASQFRLGDAGLPFGWATGVGDFNTDGRADVAVVDRISRQAGLSFYRLEFAVSGLKADDVAFESEEDSLIVSVSDVDRDSDLDVVISAAPSGQTVGVWLNDGHGRFTHADVRQLPSIGAQPTLAAAGPSLDPSPRWLQTQASFGVILVRAAPDGVGASQVVLHCAVAPLSTDTSSRIGARAPPRRIALRS